MKQLYQMKEDFEIIALDIDMWLTKYDESSIFKMIVNVYPKQKEDLWKKFYFAHH